MKKYYLACFLSLSVFLFSCEGEKIDTNSAGRSALINASIKGAKTRLADNSWSDGDSIGVYMKKSGDKLSDISVLANNVKYVTSGTNGFEAGVEDEEIRFPFNGDNVDFIGYYPFAETVSSFILSIDVSNQSDQSAIDLLYSDNAAGLNSKEPFVNMQFVHQLSKIKLNIQAENGVDMSGISVKITGIGTAASFDLSSGLLSSSSTGDVNFLVAPDGNSAEAILLPTDNLGEKDLVLAIGELTYVYPLSNSLVITSFEKSTQYTYNITLNPGEAKMAVTEGGITGWIDGSSDDFSLDPDEDYENNPKGTRDNPFTVEEARQQQEETGVWVKGYIIGYFSGTGNSSFTTSMDDQEKISQSNFVISSDVNTSSLDEKTLSVQIPTSKKIRDNINLKDNPEHFKQEILLQGNLKQYFSVPGIKDITKAVIDGKEYSQ